MKQILLILLCLIALALPLSAQATAGAIEVEGLEAGLSTVITFGGIYQSQGYEFA